MTQQSWTIGSDSQCDIVVSSVMVSGRHACLTSNGMEFTLEDLGSTNGTYVNGQRLRGSRTVTTQDRITLGQTQAMPWPESLNPQVAQPKNTMKPSMQQKRQRVITLGRGADNTVVLRETNVSTHHARLISDGDELFLEDLGSTNGTSLGTAENKISRVSVRASDTIFLGSTAYLVAELIERSQHAPIKVAKPDAKPSSARKFIALVAAAFFLGLMGWFALRGDSTAKSQIDMVPESTTAVSETLVDHVNEPPVELTVPEPVKEDFAVKPVNPDLSQQGKLSQSLYVVVCADSDRKTPFRVGTGVAIDANHVATSASVVEAIRGLKDNGYPEVFLFSPASESEYSVVSTTCHPEFESANTVARSAQREHDKIFDALEAQPPTPDAFERVKDELVVAKTKALEAIDRKTSFDVAIIKVAKPLSHWIPVGDASSRLRPNLRIEVTGYAFDVQDPYFDPASPQEVSTMKSRVGQIVQGESGSTARMIAKGSKEQFEYAYLGSPVLNTQGRLIGVYSRPSPVIAETEQAGDPVFDVALAKNLQRCFSEQE